MASTWNGDMALTAVGCEVHTVVATPLWGRAAIAWGCCEWQSHHPDNSVTIRPCRFCYSTPKALPVLPDNIFIGGSCFPGCQANRERFSEKD